ncbi:MAG: acyl-CoA/acyl-ACP dehydrogenase [Actinobacteria bacterium]|nr:acyl-CoA/acyl-ACP dehydrogenase [Actinomycetota bacterium]MBU4402432.1 acyl-CoA/acyl-ACP dehydrogenase [Actinomycetota bacterium]MBU4443271.1 acyl-CoA/acyl-ACP dehydrogenase [Actinomycetota bacterium]
MIESVCVDYEAYSKPSRVVEDDMKYQEIFPVPCEWVQDIDESMVETVARWGEQEVVSGRLEHTEDYDKLLLPAIHKLFCDIGLQSMLWPEESGGGGLETAEVAMTVAVALEQVGTADTSIGFLFANTFAVQSTFAVEPHRNEELLAELAPVFCGDDVAVGSLVLPGYGGSNAAAREEFYGLPYQVSAERHGEGWALSGEAVRPQCSGKNAAVFAVAFDAGDGGPAVALLGEGAKRLSSGEPIKKTGLAASLNADLDLKGVEVGGGRVVLTGEDRFREMLSFYYMSCAATILGSLLAAYEILKEWGNTRVIKGKGQVFKENPLDAALMGRAASRIATSRVLTYTLARMLSRPDIYGPAGSQGMFNTATATFKQVAGAAMLSMNNAMEMMASAGYATEWNLERYWRDVKTIEGTVIPETAAWAMLARHYFGCRTL